MGNSLLCFLTNKIVINTAKSNIGPTVNAINAAYPYWCFKLGTLLLIPLIEAPKIMYDANVIIATNPAYGICVFT